MQKEKIIKSVSEETFFDSKEICLDRESPVFKKNVEKIARFMSANILLSTPGCVTYIGNSRLPRRLQKLFGGRIRRSISCYWQGNTGLALLLEFLNKETGIQTLRFNIPPQDLPSTVFALQKLFRRNVVLTGDKKEQHAYIGTWRQAYRLKKKYGTGKSSVCKYANYWLWLNENIPIKEKELTDFITPA